MRKVGAAGLVFAFSACASPGTPPGGPVDTQAPQIVRIVPDSARTGVRPREVIFQFDEVVNERPSGAPSLNGLFLISPRNGEAQAEWHRSEVAVRPSRGFKANTTYTINMLPGMTDLRGNTRNTGATTVFSTGSTIASSRLTGTLFNWAEGRTIPRGLIEARPVSDTTTVYVTVTDSAGDFTLRNIPNERYRVRGFQDDNNNRGIDPREPYDTVIATVADSARVELLAFAHDSAGTRLSSVVVKDSVTLELLFDNALSVTALPTPASIRIRNSADSTDTNPVLSVTAPPVDSVQNLPVSAMVLPAAAAKLPPGAAAAVAAATAGVRKPSRPVPLRNLVVKLARPLRPRITYRVRASDIQNLIGVAKTSEKDVALPAQVAPPAASPVPGAVPPPAPPVQIKK
ncbi:MAG TPA: Ig-like domain-containing protein [Gemmatimonadaceae bacterium]|nr:Ig-like domain-containing protein [Gemmatimonadaceae bacterium]